VRLTHDILAPCCGCLLLDLSPHPGVSEGACRAGRAWPDRSLTSWTRHWSARLAGPARTRHPPFRT
jgi:hypothetical protein